MGHILKCGLAIFFLCFFANASAQKTNNVLAKEVWIAINDYRHQMQLNTLLWNEKASSIAALHSKNMANNTVAFSHTGFNQRSKVLYKIFGNTATAENIIMGVYTGLQALQLWKTSAGHHKNILGNYSYTGIGVAKDKQGNFYITQIFIQ